MTDINHAIEDHKDNSSFRTAIVSQCEQCGQAFTPRAGGRPQRFCSVECRRAFHDKPQRGNVHVASRVSVALPAVIPQPKPENASAATPEANSDFDWSDADAVALAEQYETAIYWNPKGDLVIRQRHWHDDDSLIFISKTNVGEFVDRLCDAVGIPSFGK